MSKNKVEVLLLGTLPDGPQKRLSESFRVHQAPDYRFIDASIEQRSELIQGIVSGMVWRGHPPSMVIDDQLLARFPKAEIVANFGTGYDQIDVGAANRRGVIVTNTPDVSREEVADTAFALLLCTVRRFPQADRFVKEGRWSEESFPLTPSLRNKTLGIFGMGRIGMAIAARALPFGLDVVYHNRSQRLDVPYRYYASLLEMAKDVDILMVMAPGGPETEGVITRETLEALGPDGVIVIGSRGTLLDETVLAQALRDGVIHAAGVDAYAHEPNVPDGLRELDNVVLFPHLGSASTHARDAMGDLTVDNIIGWFEGVGTKTPVPDTVVSPRRLIAQT